MEIILRGLLNQIIQYIYVNFNNFNDKDNVFKNIDKAVISEYSYYIGDDSVTIDQKSKTYAINYTTY